MLRLVEQLYRLVLLEQLAVRHEQHAVADLAGEAHLVRHDDHRHPLVRQLAHDVEQQVAGVDGLAAVDQARLQPVLQQAFYPLKHIVHLLSV